jgi:hypothetical protein
LAEAFLAGRLDLSPRAGHGWADLAPFDGRYYSALGPLPAVLFMPLAATGTYHQGAIAFLGTVAVFFLCIRLAARFDYSTADGCWFALAFCFGTSYVGIAALATSNHLAHVFAVLLLFLAILEYEGKSRLPLVGGLVGLAMACRAPAGLDIAPFVLLVCCGIGVWRVKAIKLFKLMLPLIVVAGILAVFNFVRFQNPLETGYSFQLNGFGVPYSEWNVPGNIAGPALSWAHIPANLRTFLFGFPSYMGIGTSVLLVSPFLLYLVRARWDLSNGLIALGILPVLLLILAFRSTGFEQMGYRFSLDFLPLVFWMLMRSKMTLTVSFKALIVAASILDILLTIYHMSTASLRRHS